MSKGRLVALIMLEALMLKTAFKHHSSIRRKAVDCTKPLMILQQWLVLKGKKFARLLGYLMELKVPDWCKERLYETCWLF